jgi:hypothetical protein
MLPRLARFWDDKAVQTMIGTLTKRVAFEYEKAGHPKDEAQKLAQAEIKISLSARLINIDSYYDVRAWKKSYMAERARILNEGKPKSDVIPNELKHKCYQIVEIAHAGHGYDKLLARVVTKENMVAIACVPAAFAILKATHAAWKLRIACWLVLAALVVSGFVYNRWILLALIPVFIAERYLASSQRKYLMAVAATLLALEILVADFAGWGIAFPEERRRASDILGGFSQRTEPSWLDFYLPRRAELDDDQRRAFGPSAI